MHLSIRSASRVFKMSVQYSILLWRVTIIKLATLTRSRMEKYLLLSRVRMNKRRKVLFMMLCRHGNV